MNRSRLLRQQLESGAGDADELRREISRQFHDDNSIVEEIYALKLPGFPLMQRGNPVMTIKGWFEEKTRQWSFYDFIKTLHLS